MRIPCILASLVAASFFTACGGAPAAQATPAPKVVTPAAYTASFSVKGMHCDGCAKTVTKKVKALEGITDCTVDLKGERATVSMDGAGRTTAVIDAVKKLGYEVAPIDAGGAPAANPG